MFSAEDYTRICGGLLRSAKSDCLAKRCIEVLAHLFSVECEGDVRWLPAFWVRSPGRGFFCANAVEFRATTMQSA